MDIYRENILDHGQHPRNQGVLDPADVDYEAHNALCGDRLRLTLRIDPDSRCVSAVGWDSEGCTISQAAASMLGELLIGKPLAEIQQIDKQVIYDLLGIPLSPNRIKCALLSLQALKVGLYGLGVWQQEQLEED